MVKLSEIAAVSKEDGARTYTFTSGRMTAVWEVAHSQGFTNLKDFWNYASTQDWNFYDVLKMSYREA